MSARKISIGPWTISARRVPAGTLLIEVLLGDVPHAKIELGEGKMADESRRSREETESKLETDMRF
jgi:hypothetical protein